MEDLVVKEISSRKMLLKKLDSESSLVLFKQEIEDNGMFRFTSINCKDFSTQEFRCENKAFTRFATVREIRCISHASTMDESQMLIFVNSSAPEILLFQGNITLDFEYKSKKIFLSTILINIKIGYGMFMFLPDP